MEITQEEIREEIKRMQREYKKAWRKKTRNTRGLLSAPLMNGEPSGAS